MSELKAFNFLAFNFVPYTRQCSELLFLEGDRFTDYVRLSLPAGTVTVKIKDTRDVLIYNLAVTEYSYASGVLTIDFDLPTISNKYKELYFSVEVDSVEYLISDNFTLTKDNIETQRNTRMVYFSFNEFLNDYISIRLPIVVDEATPNNSKSSIFETSDFEVIRVVPDTQEVYNLYMDFKTYKSIGRKLFNALMQRFFAVELEEGIYRRKTDFEYELEYTGTQIKNKYQFNKTPLMTGTLTFNNTQTTSLDNIAPTLFAEFYTDAELQLNAVTDTATREHLFDIILDKPLIIPDTIDYQINLLGGTVPGDFISPLTGTINFATKEILTQLSIVSLLASNLVYDIDFTITLVESGELIKIP